MTQDLIPVRREDAVWLEMAMQQSELRFTDEDRFDEVAENLSEALANPLPSGEAVGLDIEAAAKAIYDKMPFDEPNARKPKWVDGGNSFKQDEARDYARAAARAWLSPSLSETTKDQAQPDLALQEGGQRTFLVSALVSKFVGNTTTYGHRAARVFANSEGEAIGWATAQWVVDGYSMDSYDVKELDASPQVQQSEGAWLNASAAQETLDFLNSIEGHGYGGMACFEIARQNIRAALPSPPTKED